MKSKQLIIFSLFLLTISSVTAMPPWMAACGASYLATQASDCVEGKPRLPCCAMVVASIDIAFRGQAPCLCLLVREPAFLATGLDIHDILKMYSVCNGALQLGPEAANCTGIN